MASKILKILCILCGIMMINSGLNIFFNYMPLPQMSKELMSVFGSLMNVKWIMPLVAITEIVGGLLLILPKTKALGAILLLPVMLGITVHHLSYDVSGGIIGYILFSIIIFTIVENKHKYAPMVSQDN